MDINIEKNSITLFGKNEKLDVLVNRLAQLSGDQLYSFFSNRGIALKDFLSKDLELIV